uniref:Protein kinase domain-containing protein n=1 Tax=Aegilops tauschii subsp. strangulata TaxID=200361 RepID=A0A453L9M7_AEGTS
MIIWSPSLQILACLGSLANKSLELSLKVVGVHCKLFLRTSLLLDLVYKNVSLFLCSGYMAPEYITNGVISTKSDIYSLGIIIVELMTGSREYPHSSEAPFEHFIENMVGNWRHILEKTMGHKTQEICSQQVNRCIALGLKCLNPDPNERPSAWDMLQTLNELESTNGCFDKNDGPAVVTYESEVDTILGRGDVDSSNLAAKFDRILSRAFAPGSGNMSTVFRSAPKGRRILIQAFEVANTIVMASNLIKSLSKQRIRHLKEGVLRSEGVRCLISEDYSQLSILIEDEIREELRRFCKEVARFGDLCEDPQWHNLDRWFCTDSDI